jgi:hypothetical protein
VPARQPPPGGRPPPHQPPPTRGFSTATFDCDFPLRLSTASWKSSRPGARPRLQTAPDGVAPKLSWGAAGALHAQASWKGFASALAAFKLIPFDLRFAAPSSPINGLSNPQVICELFATSQVLVLALSDQPPHVEYIIIIYELAGSAAMLEEVRRTGHSADGGNDRADELAWWGKEGPPYCRLRPRGGEGASRHGPAVNYEARAERRTEEKVATARAAAAVGERRFRGGCTSGRCDVKRCGYGGRGCRRSHSRDGRCG